MDTVMSMESLELLVLYLMMTELVLVPWSPNGPATRWIRGRRSDGDWGALLCQRVELTLTGQRGWPAEGTDARELGRTTPPPSLSRR